MSSKDKYYLTLQFQNKIYRKNSTEFQSFFESIMKKAYCDFKVVRPYGNLGDGGNDGFRKNKGIYYQVNSPIKPDEKETDAAAKLTDDFNKLLINWDNIESVKKYVFVYNDKYMGTVIPFELAIANLKKANPNILFEIMLADKFENIFFKLSDDDMKVLGFDIDKLNANEIISTTFENIKIELDRGNSTLVKSYLKNCKSLIKNLSNDFQLEYKLINCSYLRSVEKYKKAIKKYNKLCKKYPEDCRAYVSLANIYLRQNRVEKSQSMLHEARKIDANNPIIQLEELNMDYILNKKIDLGSLGKLKSNISQKLKAQFYLLYSLIFERELDSDKADEYIESSIALNPNRLVSYIIKFEILENRIVCIDDNNLRKFKAGEFLTYIQEVQDQFQATGDINNRNLISFYSKKLNSNLIIDNSVDYKKCVRHIFKNITKCNLDAYIDSVLSQCLPRVKLLINEFNELLNYIKKSKYTISDALAKGILIQFTLHDCLFTDGKTFFKKNRNKQIRGFIKDLNNMDVSGITDFFNNDIQFAVEFVFSLNNPINLRKAIIDNLPLKLGKFKEKLKIQFHYDQGNYDDAFEVIKTVDLKNFHFTECQSILEIVQSKNAWELEVKLINKILEGDDASDNDYRLNLTLQLLNANMNLSNLKQVINIGEKLLNNKVLLDRLSNRNKEGLLTDIIQSYLKRGEVNKRYIDNAKNILENNVLDFPTFEFKVDIEAEVYYRKDDIKQAFSSIVEGVKIKKILSAQEYAKLHLICTAKIPQKTVKNLNSKDSVSTNSFVKLNNYDEWYYLGSDNELDAIKVSKGEDKYKTLINKKVGDPILFENKYSSKNTPQTVERIYSIEKYIIWKALESFNKLSSKGDLPGVTVIETPRTEEDINIDNLLQFFEDEKSRSQPVFDLYVKNNLPLSMLAKSEGGLHKALSKILQEQKGFINSTLVESIDKFENELTLVRDVLDNQKPFYIDGTSAFFMSEKGLFKNFFKEVSFLKVPSSVIRFLVELSAEIGPKRGSKGYIGYADGKIQLTPPEKNVRRKVQKNLLRTVRLLEKRQNNIIDISPAFKQDVFFERDIHDELGDACILSQKDGIPILTEDPNHLFINSVETKKPIPLHFSSYSLATVLYEKRLIDYDTYLEYFGYLSHYRFRCLLINPVSIERAIFGDGDPQYYKLENIDKLNLSLILSEEYGVHFRDAFKLILFFLFKIYENNDITNEVTNDIFNKVISLFPSEMSQYDLGGLLLMKSLELINKQGSFSEHSNLEKIREKIGFLIDADYDR